jgi:hypothetical protein
LFRRGGGRRIGVMKSRRPHIPAIRFAAALTAAVLPLLIALVMFGPPSPCMAMDMGAAAATGGEAPRPAAPLSMADCQNACPVPCPPALPSGPVVPVRLAHATAVEFQIAGDLRAGLTSRPDLPPPRRG